MGMAGRGFSLFFLVAVATTTTLPLSFAAVYKVGDSAGWTTIGNVDYQKWASSKTFHVGDFIHFQYNPQFHNVMLVTHPDYQACNATTPMATFTTGNDSYPIKTHGHHYFLCGIPGHCAEGQKVDINVARESSLLAPTPTQAAPSPTASASSSSTPAATAAPALSPSESPPLNALMMGLLCKLGFAMSVFVVFVSTYA